MLYEEVLFYPDDGGYKIMGLEVCSTGVLKTRRDTVLDEL